jgi:hypothetical protein
VELAPSIVADLAEQMAKRYRLIAIVPFAVATLLLATHAIGPGWKALLICGVIPVFNACVSLAQARSVLRIYNSALRFGSVDSSRTWRLVGTKVVAESESFQISTAMARSLREAPRAVVIS